MKYPQINGSSRARHPGPKPALNAGPSAERPERTSVGRELRDRLSGAVEAISRRNVLASGDHFKHRSLQDVTTSRDVQRDTDKGNISRLSSSSRRAAGVSSSRPTSSGEPGDSRGGRVGSNGVRHSSTVQRLHQVSEPRSASRTRASASRGIRDDHIRSFELLSLRK